MLLLYSLTIGDSFQGERTQKKIIGKNTFSKIDIIIIIIIQKISKNIICLILIIF